MQTPIDNIIFDSIIEHSQWARALILVPVDRSTHSQALSLRLTPGCLQEQISLPAHFQIPQPLLPMSSYWSLFPDFDHNPNAPIKDEFQRLAKLKGWTGRDEQKKKNYRREWGKCFNSEFEKYYGGDASVLAGWQSLCFEVGLDVIPESVHECRQVSNSHIDIRQ
jgi:hypothetical protein